MGAAPDTIEPFLVVPPATPSREFSCSVDYCCSDPKNRPRLVHIPCFGRKRILRWWNSNVPACWVISGIVWLLTLLWYLCGKVADIEARPIVNCAPLAGLGDAYDVRECQFVSHGFDCSVYCADGYTPHNTDELSSSFRCP